MFLSFSKNKNTAIHFMLSKSCQNKSNVLFVVEKDKNLDFSLLTHADIEQFSVFPGEGEVLFFPFSSFEIKSIQEFSLNNEKAYQINLFYLGKYLKKFKKDKNLIYKKTVLPNSKFMQNLSQSNLVKPQKLKKINNEQIFKKYEDFKSTISNEKKK